MQQPFFRTIPARSWTIPQMRQRTEAERFSSISQGLTKASTKAMMPIANFDWTSGARLPIVIWCNATM
jgi:hypothetical protein